MKIQIKLRENKDLKLNWKKKIDNTKLRMVSIVGVF